MTDAPISEYIPEVNFDNMTIEELKAGYAEALRELREQDETPNVPTADDVALAVIAGLCAQPSDPSDIATTVQQAVALAWQVAVPQYMAERQNSIVQIFGDQSGGV